MSYEQQEPAPLIMSARSSSPQRPSTEIFDLGDHRTVEQVVAAKLREAILTGSLKPNERLAYRDLAHRFGVSVTPVRIALRELSNEGLVEMRAHAGARVSPLSVDEIEEIFATRIGIEGWLARHGAPRLREAEIAEMTVAMEGLREAERNEDPQSYMTHSWTLRATCYQAAEKPRLFDRFHVLYELARRYLYLMMAEQARLERSLREMEQFFAAARARNGIASEEAIHVALWTTLSYLSEAFDRERDPPSMT